jgi:hypothetical protein
MEAEARHPPQDGRRPGIDTDTEPGLENYLRLSWFARTFVRVFNRHESMMWWAIPFSLWFTTWRYADHRAGPRPMTAPRTQVWLLADMAIALASSRPGRLYDRVRWMNLLVLVLLSLRVSGYVSAVAFVPNHRGMPPLTDEQGRRASRFTHLNSPTVLYPPYLPATTS